MWKGLLNNHILSILDDTQERFSCLSQQVIWAGAHLHGLENTCWGSKWAKLMQLRRRRTKKVKAPLQEAELEERWKISEKYLECCGLRLEGVHIPWSLVTGVRKLNILYSQVTVTALPKIRHDRRLPASEGLQQAFSIHPTREIESPGRKCEIHCACFVLRML